MHPGSTCGEYNFVEFSSHIIFNESNFDELMRNIPDLDMFSYAQPHGIVVLIDRTLPISLANKRWFYCMLAYQNPMHASTASWRYQMETFSAPLALCPGNSPVTGEFPSQRPVTWSFVVFLSAPEQTVEQTIETPVIRDATALIMTSL